MDRGLKPQRTIERVTNEIQHLEKEVEKAQSEFDTCVARIQTLKEENETFRSSLPQLQVALSIVEAYEQSLELAKQGAAYNTDFDTTEAHLDIKQALDTVSTTYAKKEVSKAEYEQAKAMLDAMLPEYTKAKEKLETANRLLEEKQNELSAYLDVLLSEKEYRKDETESDLTTSNNEVQTISSTNKAVQEAPVLTVNGTVIPQIEAEDLFEDIPAMGDDAKADKKANQKAKKAETTNESIPVLPIAGGSVVVAGGLAAFLAKKKKEGLN